MISFCIITAGERPEKLHNLLASIAIQMYDCFDTVIAVDSMHKGRLGALRNQACSAARGEVFVVCDDDITFEPDFVRQILIHPPDWNIMLPRITNPDGSRYWDWREWYGEGKPVQQAMIPYDRPDTEYVMPSGACVIVRREVWQKVKWSETMKFYEPPGEDIDWGLNLHLAGYYMTSNPLAIAHHNDNRYSQSGNCVMRYER